MGLDSKSNIRILLALLLPFVTCGVQWLFWSVFAPFVWFLFFPTVFFSSRIGGKSAGVISTVISAILVVYFFIPPQLSFIGKTPSNLYSVLLFLFMGVLFSYTHERLERADRRAVEAQEATRIANEQLQEARIGRLEAEQRLAEKTLRESEDLLNTMGRTAKVGGWDLNPVTGEGHWTEETARIHDLDPFLKPDKEMGIAFYQGESRTRIEAAIREATEHGTPYDLELELISATGKHKWVRTIGHPVIEDGRVVKLRGSFQDITDRKQAEVALIQSEEKFSRAFSCNPAAIALTRLKDGLFLDVNDTWVSLCGYSREEAIGHSSRTMQIWPTAEAAQRFVDELNEKGMLQGWEQEFRDKSGKLFVAQLSSQILDVGGEQLILSTLVDITTQKQAEIALRESEVRFRSIFDHAPVAIGIGALADGRLFEVNAFWLQLLGFERDEVIGRTTSELGLYVDENERARIVTAITEHGRIVNTDIRIRNKSGEILNIMFSAEIITLDSTPYLQVMMSDVTEQRRGELALRESEERQRVFIEHAPAALAMFDRGMRYLHASRRWLQDYGLGDRKLTGLSHYEVFPEISDTWKETHRRGLAGEVLRKDADRFDRADGSVQWVRWEIRPWHDANGAVGGLFIFSEDITDLKLAEDEIIQLNASLEQRVEERTAELQAANQELDAFAYAVSHDLRAPLRAMNGFSQALSEDYGEQLHGEALVYLKQISLASQHMGNLLEGLLTLSRSTRGDLHRDLLDLSDTAGLIRDELVRLEPGRQVAWQIESGMSARGDASMLEVVMRNLIGNAWKYTAGIPAPMIRVYCEQRDGSTCYCVADNGAGFDMRHAERLFKPFQRLHRQDEFPGIGIGLATVQRIVRRHGGEISAEAEPGAGATFRFTLAGSGVVL
ncbi:MAG: hypothetical protein CXR30_15115 [Geobacter sp.]|nr:MAG: hypothetical protein CXR30_15115 [Geobacter sp.]